MQVLAKEQWKYALLPCKCGILLGNGKRQRTGKAGRPNSAACAPAL